MIKYIFLTLFIISILTCVYYVYARLLNKKLNNKKLYIGENASRDRYVLKTTLSFSCVVGTFGLFMFSMFVVPTVSLMNSFVSIDEYNELRESNDKKDYYTLMSYSQSENNFDYQYAKATNDNIYVITNDKVIKYDIEKKINKTYVFDSYSNGSSIYVVDNKVIGYVEYNNYSNIFIFDENLNLIENFKINSLLKYITINNNILNVITNIDFNDDFKIINSKNVVDLLEYNELEFNIKNLSNIICDTKIDLNTFEINQKGICVNDVNYILNDYLYIITEKHNANNLVINELYQYDLSTQTIINIKDIAGSVIEVNSKLNNINITLNFGDNIYRQYVILYNNKKLEVINNSQELNNSDIDLNNNILNVYCDAFNVNGNNAKVIACEDFNIYIYAIIKDNNIYTYLKLTKDYEVVLKERTNEAYFIYTNKFLITYDYNGVIETKVINDSIGE